MPKRFGVSPPKLFSRNETLRLHREGSPASTFKKFKPFKSFKTLPGPFQGSNDSRDSNPLKADRLWIDCAHRVMGCSGNVNQNRLPLSGSLSTPICPPINSTSCLEIAKPSPIPS